MATRRSMGHVLMDSSVYTNTSTSSPLRRKSMLPQKLASDLSENNDEAERMARRKEINIVNTPLRVSNGQEKRRSIGLGFLAQMSAPQIADRISQCIKLSAENKINIKNAFSLEIIDFMTYMIKKQDVNMSNLQMASTSLDVSTKIYGFRVDGIHTELLKLIGGLEKQNKDRESGSEDNEKQTPLSVEEKEETSAEKQKVKRKKRKQKIITTSDLIKGNIETARPLPLMMCEDSQTTDMLYQVMFSCHASSQFYLHQYNDAIMDTVDHKSQCNKEQLCIIPKIDDISNLSLCPALPTFEFLQWIEDEQPAEFSPIENNENRFQFDLDASLPDDDMQNSVRHLDVEHEERACEEGLHATEHVVDFREAMAAAGSAKTSEYSFVQKNLITHWAGLSHWKVSHLKKSFANSKIVETCHQAPTKKRIEFEIHYDDRVKEQVKEKFSPGKAVKLQARTAKAEWNEEKLTLPRDMHYNIADAAKLYLHVLISLNSKNKDDLNTTHFSDAIDNYDYNNENDTSNYCPDIVNRDYGETDSNNEEHDNYTSGDIAGITLAGNNLVAAPKVTNKICIAYSLKAKKIDMRQLKKSIWKTLVSAGDTTEESTCQEMTLKMKKRKCFSEVYKALPGLLTKSNAEALSFPISFVSLLHLANEKTLKINMLPDMSDIIVEEN